MAADNEEDNELDRNAVILTMGEFLEIGLKVFFTEERIKTFRSYKSQVDNFKEYFGCTPLIAAKLWEDLQRTSIPEAKLDPDHLEPKHFLMALHHLQKYPTDKERVGPWNINRDEGRELVWYYLEKIQALKGEVIVWPDDEEWSNDIWIVTVDGTHCWIEEPQHPDWSQDKKWYSHKYNKAGVNYELAIAIASSRLVWMNGPFRAAKGDNKVFRKNGLKKLLQRLKKKAIGDRGYNGHPNEVSTYNAHDRRGVRKFKSRALKRHENFNGMTKRFGCLKGRFRHSVKRFATCFEAICVICQYQCEMEQPLYDVLIEDIMDEEKYEYK
jgi:hypothetical protein